MLWPSFFNSTNYSGLETHILNSYTNSIVQAMHYIHPVRALAKAHITVDCPREHCLLCEMGFVFRMLEDARGTNCQASNFCKTVGVLAQGLSFIASILMWNLTQIIASNAIELIDYGREGPEVDYAQKIQTFHRFLLDHINSESILQTVPSSPPSLSPSPITELFGLAGTSAMVCSHCKDIREKRRLTHVVDLVYPNRVSHHENPTRIDTKECQAQANETAPITFSSLVQTSIFQQIPHKAPCQKCKQFSTFISQRSASSRQLPPVLAINASVYNDESFAYWQDHRGSTFLQPKITLRGQVSGEDDSEEVEYSVRVSVFFSRMSWKVDSGLERL